MRVRVTYDAGATVVDEIFTGATAEEVVAAMQKEVASKMSFLVRAFVMGMSPTEFAQEVISRYNLAAKKSLTPPQNCDEFLEQGIAEGIATVVEP